MLAVASKLISSVTYFSGEAQAKYRPHGEYTQHRRLPSGLCNHIINFLSKSIPKNISPLSWGCGISTFEILVEVRRLGQYRQLRFPSMFDLKKTQPCQQLTSKCLVQRARNKQISYIHINCVGTAMASESHRNPLIFEQKLGKV